jgi:hypothetical protein
VIGKIKPRQALVIAISDDESSPCRPSIKRYGSRYTVNRETASLQVLESHIPINSPLRKDEPLSSDNDQAAVFQM